LTHSNAPSFNSIAFSFSFQENSYSAREREREKNNKRGEEVVKDVAELGQYSDSSFSILHSVKGVGEGEGGEEERDGEREKEGDREREGEREGEENK